MHTEEGGEGGDVPVVTSECVLCVCLCFRVGGGGNLTC